MIVHLHVHLWLLVLITGIIVAVAVMVGAEIGRLWERAGQQVDDLAELPRPELDLPDALELEATGELVPMNVADPVAGTAIEQAHRVSDPPGPSHDPALTERSTTGRAGGPRPGRGRADRRDWHKHRGPYAPAAERHVTLTQAEAEAAEWLHDREFRAWEQEMAGLIGEAWEWWRGLPDGLVTA